MDIGSFFLTLSVFLLAAFFIARPFLDDQASSVSAADREYSSVLADREQILDALQELDFDFKLGKIPDGEYPEQRAKLLERGSAVLEKLDMLEAAISADRLPMSDAIEKAIADRRESAEAGPRQPVSADDNVERLIATRKRDQSSRPTGFCPQCGQAIHQTDKFCSKCGTTLA